MKSTQPECSSSARRLKKNSSAHTSLALPGPTLEQRRRSASARGRWFAVQEHIRTSRSDAEPKAAQDTPPPHQHPPVRLAHPHLVLHREPRRPHPPPQPHALRAAAGHIHAPARGPHGAPRTPRLHAQSQAEAQGPHRDPSADPHDYAPARGGTQRQEGAPAVHRPHPPHDAAQPHRRPAPAPPLVEPH
ncbi:hypothetical protein B0H12DRAFT_301888 [Mycena haematopus]|nr:hypothetical protein B0H12DRAFT_301888 [Mycena haematopus]